MCNIQEVTKVKRIADACLYLSVAITLAFVVIFIAGEAKANTETDIAYASVISLGSTKEEVTSEMFTRGAVLTTEEDGLQLWDHKEYFVSVKYKNNVVVKAVSFMDKRFLGTNEYESLIDEYYELNGAPSAYSHKDVYIVWTGNDGEFAAMQVGKYMVLIATHLFDAENTVYNVREMINKNFR